MKINHTDTVLFRNLHFTDNYGLTFLTNCVPSFLLQNSDRLPRLVNEQTNRNRFNLIREQINPNQYFLIIMAHFTLTRFQTNNSKTLNQCSNRIVTNYSRVHQTAAPIRLSNKNLIRNAGSQLSLTIISHVLITFLPLPYPNNLTLAN